MDELRKIQRPGLPYRQREYDWFAGILAVERGEYDVALKEFSKSLSKFLPNHPPQYHYALALLKSGRIGEAITEFQRMTWCPAGAGPFSAFSPMDAYWPIAAVKAHYWLGVAYEQQGKRDQAVKEYNIFLDIWKNADFKSKEMQDAHTRLAMLRETKK
jgi:tetratricopeptide (TPR) repeat protein